MKKLTKILVFSVLAVFLLAGSAMSAPFNSNRPYTGLPYDQYFLDNSTWQDDWLMANEPTLQDILDANITNGSLNAEDDQSDVGAWMSAEGIVDSYLIAAIGGDVGTLGIYSGKTGAEYDLGSEVDLALLGNTIGFAISDSGALWLGGVEVDSNFGEVFGFYWKTDTLTGYTEDDLNDQNGYGPDSNILALTYLVPDGFEVYTQAYGGLTMNATGDNDWIIAFEDRPYGDEWGDGDFNDGVFYIEDMDPVPEPATMLLLGSGLVGLAAFGRKKFFKK